MFAVFTCQTFPDGILFSRLSAARRRLHIYADDSLGVRVMRADMTLTLSTAYAVRRGMARRAMQAASDAGIREVVLPADFEWRGELSEFGLREPDETALYRAMADRLALCAAKRRAVTKLAVLSKKLDAAAERTLETLCRQVRYPALYCAQDAGELAGRLRREYGVSLMVNPPAGFISESELVVIFDMPARRLPALKEDGLTLMLCRQDGAALQGKTAAADGAAIRAPERLLRYAPECRLPRLLAAMASSGALDPGRLEPETLTLGGRPVF